MSKTTWAKCQRISIAQKAQIIQRVLVDGWTTPKAAATFGFPEQLIGHWVADYRRHGMASLCYEPSKTLAAEFVKRIPY